LNHLRRAVVAAATAACACLLSGCVVIQNVSEQQVDGVGPVRVTVQLCSSGDDAACVEQGHPSGGNEGNAGADQSSPPAPTQLLIGFRIPDAYAAPPAPTSADHPEVTFTASPSYAAGLEAQSPSGPGQQWVGFISSTTGMGNGSKAPGTVDAMTVTAGFAVPAGAPPFNYRPIVGARSAGSDPTRAVNCNETVTFNGQSAPTTFCVDSPSTAVTGASALGTNRPVAVRGLALTATPAPVKGARGTRVPVPFTAVLSGNNGSAGLFTVAGTTTVPNGVVRGRRLPLSGPGRSPALVRVSVPRSTRPGTYLVNATVTQGAQTRTITRSLVVTGKAAKLKLGTRFGSRLDRRGRSAVTISCPASAEQGCVGSVTLNTASRVVVPAAKAKRRVLRLGKARFRLKAGTKGTLRIKVGRKGRKILRTKGKLRVKATIVTGRGSTTARAGRFYTLRVAKKKR